MNKEHSDGQSADYYKIPIVVNEVQDLISYWNLNAQLGEMVRSIARYGKVSHSSKLRDAKKMKYYAEAEIARIEKYESHEE